MFIARKLNKKYSVNGVDLGNCVLTNSLGHGCIFVLTLNALLYDIWSEFLGLRYFVSAGMDDGWMCMIYVKFMRIDE